MSSRNQMESLCEQLESLSSHVPAITKQTGKPGLLATLSHTHFALLNPSPPTLLLLPRTTVNNAPHTIPLPPDAHTLLPAREMLAILGDRSVTVLHSESQPPLSIAQTLFDSRPNLKLLHAAWSPHAHAFLMILTSDGCLRLYDVASRQSAAVERFRLRVVTNAAAPVAFAFGRGDAWESLCVYVIASDGSIFVAAPIAPIGTRLPADTHATMMRSARRAQLAALERDGNHSPPGTPRKTLMFDDDVGWGARQAAMQLRFLETVFEKTASGDMIAVREFKPAPLLFQGPLYVEHDDVPDPPPTDYVSLTLLSCGADTPPVLLRASTSCGISTLITLERVEAQWYLNPPNSFENPDTPLEASEDYAECARAVSPLLLCFEHFDFSAETVTLFRIGGAVDADVVFAVTPTTVHSIRLSFISVLSNADALERTPKSTISPMLSTANPTDQTKNKILGLAPSYSRGEGPVAVVLTADGQLHVTAPVRWITDFDVALPPKLLAPRPAADLIWDNERPTTGNRAYACPEAGKETLDLLQHIQTLQGEHGSRVAPGTLGCVADVKSFATILEYLERRVAVFTGGPDGAGIGDSLGDLASILMQWADELREHVNMNEQEAAEVNTILTGVENSESALKIKLQRVEQLGFVLKERMKTILETLESGNSEISPAEAERHSRLKEKKRRMAALRARVEELSAAVKIRNKAAPILPNGDRYSTPTKNSRSPATKPRQSPRWSVSPSWRTPEGSLARRKADWSPRSDSLSLSRAELQQIKLALEKHSREISEAMDLSSDLWKRLSVT